MKSQSVHALEERIKELEARIVKMEKTHNTNLRYTQGCLDATRGQLSRTQQRIVCLISNLLADGNV